MLQTETGRSVLSNLVGLSDQFTDVYTDVGCFLIISHWGLLHRGRQRAVFICHIVEEPEPPPPETKNNLQFTEK